MFNDLTLKRTNNAIFFLIKFSFESAEVDLQVEVDFVTAAQIRKVTPIFHVSHTSVGVTTMHIFANRHGNCTLVAHINDGNAIVLQLCYINIRAAAIDGQSGSQF